MQFTINNPLYECVKLKHRYFLPTDYPMFSSWWESWGWDPFPELLLPPTGIIVSNQGVDICGGFLYKTDSLVCWAENYISNKEAPRELRAGSIEYLINCLAEEGRRHGFKIMMSSVSHKGLVTKLIASGFDPKYEDKMCNLMRVL